MSIFDMCPPAQEGDKLEYFNFKNIGDFVEGTLVDRKRDLQGKFGMQDAFGIKLADGRIVYVSAKHASKGFFGQMDKLTLGQIIGLKYTKDIPTNYGNAYKFIHLAQDPSIVDVAWVADRDAKKAAMMAELNGDIKIPAGDLFPTVATTTAPTPTPVAAPVVAPVAPVAQPELPVIEIPALEPLIPVMTDQEKVMKIAQVIRDRFGVTTGEEIKAKVAEQTGMVMVAMNLDAIIAKLG